MAQEMPGETPGTMARPGVPRGTALAAWSVVRDAARGWLADGVSSMGAAVAFYTIFSLAPTMILVIAVAGAVLGEAAATGALMSQLAGLVGTAGAETVQDLILAANRGESGPVAALVGAGTLLVGATTVFTELQSALNRIWRAQPPASSTVAALVTVRLRGLALIGAIGALLVASLLASALLAGFGSWLSRTLPVLAAVLTLANWLVPWALFTVLFALIYRVLPDTHIAWSDVWLGAATTAFLFVLGKSLIGLYLGTSGVSSAYGAAGSFVLVLLWVYYSAQILLFGAEITRAFSESYGSRSRPG